MPSDKDPKPVKVKPPKRAKPTKIKAKDWLKAHGHKAKDVDDALDAETVETSIAKLHGVTTEQWKTAKQ